MTEVEAPDNNIYEFGKFRVDAGKRLLTQGDGEAVPLMPKAFDTLLYLVRNAGKIVEKDDLLSSVWPDTVVEENNLTQNISILRRVFGEKPGEHKYIATVPGRGYKFVADVNVANLSDPGPFEETSRAATDSQPTVVIQKKGYANGAGRWWLVTLTVFVFFGLSTVGFLYWRENAGQINARSVRSIAVLPFKPIASEDRDESLEMGMAEALISKLNSGEGITVRPLSAVRRFASLEQNSIEAGRALGVEAVLEGTIQTAGERVRVSTKLTRVADGKQLWAGRFDERSADIFALQDSISERVAGALQITLGSRRSKRYTENVEAYQLYMKGNFHRSRLILPEVQKAISYYEQAIAVDPLYALAYVGIADACHAMLLTNDARPDDAMPKAKAAALKALELDDDLAEAHRVVATVTFWYDWDWKTAEKHYLRAREIDPESPQLSFFYAHMLSNTGRHDLALAEIKRARERDPVSLITNALEGQVLTFAGKDDEALKILQATVEMDPNFWLAHLFMSRTYLKKEMYSEAIAAATRAKEITRGNAEATATIGYALARSGRADDARRVLKELEDRATTRYVSAYAPAQIYCALGEKEKALDELERAFSNKDVLMAFLKVEPKWESLRSEPRFVDLIKRMKFDQ